MLPTHLRSTHKQSSWLRSCWGSRLLIAAVLATQLICVVILQGGLQIEVGESTSPRSGDEAPPTGTSPALDGSLLTTTVPSPAKRRSMRLRTRGRAAPTDLLTLAYDPACTAWRATTGCSGPGGPPPTGGDAVDRRDRPVTLGERRLSGDRYCFESVPSDEPGFCECSLGRVASPVGCGHPPFRCRDVCASRYPGANHVSARGGQLRLWQEPACVAFRTTASCVVVGRRLAAQDVPCGEPVGPELSGYCECAGGRIARPTACDHPVFTCDEVCAPGHPMVPGSSLPTAPVVAEGSDATDTATTTSTESTIVVPVSTPVSAPAPTSESALVVTAVEAAAVFSSLEPWCVGWRATSPCDPYGPRHPVEDKPCGATVPSGVSGFCECTGGRVASVVGCLHAPLTCADRCAALLHRSQSHRAVAQLADQLQLLLPDTMQWQQACIAWRETGDCTAEGPREYGMDQACSQLILSTSSGFCECERGRLVHLVACDAHQPTSCEEECMRPIAVQQAARSRDEKVVTRADRLAKGEAVVGCSAWRGLATCDPLSKRSPVMDHRCDTIIHQGSAGYCECAFGAAAHRTACNENTGGFTCDDECAQLGDPAVVKAKMAAARDLRISCPPEPGEGDGDHEDDDDGVGVVDAFTSLVYAADAAADIDAELHDDEDGTQHGADASGGDQVAGHAPRKHKAKKQHKRRVGRGDPAATGVGGGLSGSGLAYPQTAAAAAAAPAQLAGGRWLWERLFRAYEVAMAGESVVIPGRRDAQVDFVVAGDRLPAADAARARGQWTRFLEAAPKYESMRSRSPPLFGGRGIVIAGGGLKYLVPAWVNIRMLRRSGCTLPVELWLLTSEQPPAAMVADLAAQGVLLRNLDALYVPLESRGAPMPMLDSYAIKAAAVLFSSFEEVLFLDADNTAVADPTYLFESPGYVAAGAMLWRDFWPASVAPDFYVVAGMDAAAGPAHTHESGQLLLHKGRHWAPALLALFYNLQAVLYYRLLTDFLGQGDKETLPLAMAVLGTAPHVVPTPVGAAGVWDPRQGRFRGNTMVHESPDGVPRSILFLHANLMKWHLQLPRDFAKYRRRWDFVLLGSGDGHTLLPWANATSNLGYDVERSVYDILVDLRCRRGFRQYARLRAQRFGDTAAIDLGATIESGTGKDDPTDPTTYGMHFDAATGVRLAERLTARAQKAGDHKGGDVKPGAGDTKGGDTKGDAQIEASSLPTSGDVGGGDGGGEQGGGGARAVGKPGALRGGDAPGDQETHVGPDGAVGDGGKANGESPGVAQPIDDTAAGEPVSEGAAADKPPAESSAAADLAAAQKAARDEAESLDRE